MKYLIGMSGGLDSTYAAYLLQSQGHAVEGAFLQMHEHGDLCAAQTAAAQVGIPLHVIDCRAAFEESVIADFLQQYQNGRTPNPCVVCNRFVKVGKLCEFASQNGFDAVVTGHYARIGQENGRYFVLRAADAKKDQSYMLWRLTQDQLSLLRTPLCDLSKEEIRQKATELGFSCAKAKESQDICFLPNGDYVSFVERRIGAMPQGDFCLPDGTVLGRHQGLLRYTVGQRKGLGIAYREPLYVTALDPKRNVVTVAPAGKEFAYGFTAISPVFGAIEPPSGEKTAAFDVKIRYSATMAQATVTYTKDTVSVHFSTPQRAVTPGQSAVFYLGDRLAFGAIIDQAISSDSI